MRGQCYLDNDGLVALEVVYPVSPRRPHVLLVLGVLLRHPTGPRNLVSISIIIRIITSINISIILLRRVSLREYLEE